MSFLLPAEGMQTGECVTELCPSSALGHICTALWSREWGTCGWEETTPMAVNPGSKSYTSIYAVVMFPLLLHELATGKQKGPCLLPLPSHHHLLHQLTTSQGSHTDPGQAQAALCSHHPFFSLLRCREEALFLEATVVEFLRRDAEKWYRCTWTLCWICPCLHISWGKGNAGQWHGSLSHFLPV